MPINTYKNSIKDSKIRVVISFTGCSVEEIKAVGPTIVVLNKDGSKQMIFQDQIADFLNDVTGRNQEKRIVSEEMERSIMKEFSEVLIFENEKYSSIYEDDDDLIRHIKKGNRVKVLEILDKHPKLMSMDLLVNYITLGNIDNVKQFLEIEANSEIIDFLKSLINFSQENNISPSKSLGLLDKKVSLIPTHYELKVDDHSQIKNLNEALLIGFPRILSIKIVNRTAFSSEKINIAYKYIELLISATSSSRCSQNFHLDLSNVPVGDNNLIILASNIKKGLCPQGFKIDLYNSNISSKGVKKLAEGLSSIKCPSDLSINIGGNPIDDEGIIFLFEELSKHCPENLSIDLSGKNISDKAITAVENFLLSGNCAKGVSIKINNSAWTPNQNSISSDKINSFFKTLFSGKCKPGLTIGLKRYEFANNIGNKGIIAFAKSLYEGICPQDFKIILKRNGISDDGIIELTKILSMNKDHQGLSIDLGYNNIQERGIEAIGNLLAMDTLLKEIGLTGIKFSPNSILSLYKGLLYNFTLDKLELNTLKKDQKEVVDSLLKRKQQLPNSNLFFSFKENRDVNINYIENTMKL